VCLIVFISINTHVIKTLVIAKTFVIASAAWQPRSMHSGSAQFAIAALRSQ
jgi:hypothetical protein